MKKFRADPKIARNLLRQEGVRELVDAKTEAVYQAAVVLSGARKNTDRFSDEKFADTLDTEVTKDRTRWLGRVTTDHEAWDIIEYGSSRQAAKAPLRRAIEAVGLKQTRYRR